MRRGYSKKVRVALNMSVDIKERKREIEECIDRLE